MLKMKLDKTRREDRERGWRFRVKNCGVPWGFKCQGGAVTVLHYTADKHGSSTGKKRGLHDHTCLPSYLRIPQDNV